MRRLLVLTALLFALPAHAVNMDWVTVGDPGNACDDQPEGFYPGCFGAVAYTYRIGKYEVTNAQYTVFLRAVAKTDTYGLYSTSMGSVLGGIVRTGNNSGGYTYYAILGRGDMPVNFVSFYDALRFANWLHNGQPTGWQDSTTTEDGAYTFSGPTSVGSRNAGATIFLTSEDEWYKAAYYDALSTSYFDYPAGADAQTGCVLPSGDTGNSANCNWVVGDLTDAGAYSLSGSPYGTFDQGGNVWEWNEAIIIGSYRGHRDGSFGADPGILAASYRDGASPASEGGYTGGFRVAMVPEPTTALLRAAALLVLGVLAATRRRSLQ